MTKKIQSHQLSPNDYIRTKARTLPIYRCFISSTWIEFAFAAPVIVRQQPGGNFIIGLFFVDIFCKGVMKTVTHFNIERNVLDQFIANYIPRENEEGMLIEIDYALAHNIIYGGIAFAKSKGYNPVKDFEISKYILKDENENVEYIKIDFGVSEFSEKIIRDNNGFDIFNKNLK